MTKVLLADDDFLVRTYLSQLIDWEKHGYTLVGTARDGEEALQMAEEYHPHIIITDISMPILDGISVIRLLRSRGDDIRIIALSCHDDFEYVKEAMRLGADEYVLKNVLTEQSLLNLLEQMKGKIQLSQEGSPFENAEQERDYYLSLLRTQDDVSMTKDGFHISAALAVQIVNSADSLEDFRVERREKFDSSFAQLCRESSEKIPIRCIPVHPALYAVLMDFHGIPSVYERQQLVQQSASKLRRYVERYLALSVQIGTSKVGGYQNSPYQCWQEALDSLNERFYIRQSIFYGWQIQDCGRELTEEARDFCQNIASYIGQKNSYAIRIGWSAALESLEREHTEEHLVRDWLKQCDRNAGIAARPCPAQFSELSNLVLQYLTFPEELLPQEEQYSNMVSGAVRYVKENFQNRISLNEVADQVHLNATYLSHLFHKETGITFSEYLTSCRINKAKELLLHSAARVQEIGRESGFGDHRNFIKMFKKATGMTPQEYRRKMGK